jgi:hypothetical protein
MLCCEDACFHQLHSTLHCIFKTIFASKTIKKKFFFEKPVLCGLQCCPSSCGRDEVRRSEPCGALVGLFLPTLGDTASAQNGSMGGAGGILDLSPSRKTCPKEALTQRADGKGLLG